MISKYHREKVKCEDCLFARPLQENPEVCWCRRRQLKSHIHSEQPCPRFVSSIAYFKPSLSAVATMLCLKAFVEEKFAVKLPEDLQLRLIPPYESSMSFQIFTEHSTAKENGWGGCTGKPRFPGQATVIWLRKNGQAINQHSLLHELIHLAKPEASEKEVRGLSEKLFVEGMAYTYLGRYRRMYKWVKENRDRYEPSRCWVWEDLEGMQTRKDWLTLHELLWE